MNQAQQMNEALGQTSESSELAGFIVSDGKFMVRGGKDGGKKLTKLSEDIVDLVTGNKTSVSAKLGLPKTDISRQARSRIVGMLFEALGEAIKLVVLEHGEGND